jgi:glycosyltransferase involved in cell wall biosynthesis
VKLRLVVPGPIGQATGGYRYAATMLAAWRTAGHDVALDELPGRFPDADSAARAAARACLARRRESETLLVDGLALPAFASLDLTRTVALVHHPLGLETGLSPAQARDWLAREAAWLRPLDGIVVTSAATVRDLIAMGLDPARLAHVDPATEAARGAPSRAATPTVLCVATLTPRKDHPTLLKALARLRGRRWRCDLVGSASRDPAQAARVRALVRALSLGRRVRLLGEAAPEALARHYRAARVFALPSRHEGYGMAFAEALAHGLPIAGVAAGAVPSVVPRRAGILVPPGDPRALARALARLLGPAARRLSHNARALRFPDRATQAARLWHAVEGFAR